MTSYNRDGKVGPWAREKLRYLEKYLTAYTTILNKQKFRAYFYIDAFAGGGRAPLRSESIQHQTGSSDILPGLGLEQEQEVLEYVDGSPRVALGIQPPFTQYVFIEQSRERANALNRLRTEFPSRKISVYQEAAEHVIENKILSSNLNWKNYRGVIFLDPFGLQVKWSLLEEIAKTGALEVFINFPVGMAIQRKLARDPRRLSHSDLERLNEYFGSSEWFDVVYRGTNDLFSDKTLAKNRDAGEALAEWYQSRLTSVFGYGARPRLVKNHRGAHIYYLLFAGPNPTGAKIADYILQQGTSSDQLL